MWISRQEYKELVASSAREKRTEELNYEYSLKNAALKTDHEQLTARLAAVEAANLKLQDEIQKFKSQQAGDSRQVAAVNEDLFEEDEEAVGVVIAEMQKDGLLPVLARYGAGDNAANS